MGCQSRRHKVAGGATPGSLAYSGLATRPHIWGATPCIKDRPRPGVRPTLRSMNILKRTATFCQSVGGPPGTAKAQTQVLPRFEGDEEEENRKLIVLQRAHGAIQ